MYTKGDRDPFYFGMRTELSRNMDTAQLQNWAVMTLSQHPFDDYFIDGNELPAFLRINEWRPSGASVRAVDGSRFLEICWGEWDGRHLWDIRRESRI
jgi:hypothetical protein